MTPPAVKASLPRDFHGTYSDTQVILDCTELRCQTPSSLLLQSEVFSKSHCTFKAMVGVSPHGALTFVSTLFEGSMSDTKVFRQSRITSLLIPDMAIMVDKGFLVDDLVPGRVHRPAFLSQRTQMLELSALDDEVRLPGALLCSLPVPSCSSFTLSSSQQTKSRQRSLWEAVVATASNISPDHIRTLTNSVDGRLMTVIEKKVSFLFSFFLLSGLPPHPHPSHLTSPNTPFPIYSSLLLLFLSLSCSGLPSAPLPCLSRCLPSAPLPCLSRCLPFAPLPCLSLYSSAPEWSSASQLTPLRQSTSSTAPGQLRDITLITQLNNKNRLILPLPARLLNKDLTTQLSGIQPPRTLICSSQPIRHWFPPSLDPPFLPGPPIPAWTPLTCFPPHHSEIHLAKPPTTSAAPRSCTLVFPPPSHYSPTYNKTPSQFHRPW
ncbi:uncharacterized protein LOC110970886 isoform X3 [Acanthochromis polyacanthus]|nr:uncharacterized protein LOC110970886 isoform X3 [Acanthochromis polyacanthus]